MESFSHETCDINAALKLVLISSISVLTLDQNINICTRGRGQALPSDAPIRRDNCRRAATRASTPKQQDATEFRFINLF